MTTSHYDLKFTIASRTIFSKRLRLIHSSAFGKSQFSNFHLTLPSASTADFDGYMVHSVEIQGNVDPLSSRNGYLLYVTETFPRYVTRFEGSFEDFLGRMSSKTRSTLKRKVRKFAKLSSDELIDWRRYESPDEIEQFFQLSIPLAQRTYQAKLFDGALPDTAEFKQEAMDIARQGRLRAYILFQDDCPIAYLYTPLENGAYVYAYLGYDLKMADLSPGTVLQYLVHEQLFTEKKVELFDFTEGDGPHKALFASESTQCCNVLYLQNTRRNKLLVMAHHRWNRTIEAIKNVAIRYGLNSKLKRFFR